MNYEQNIGVCALHLSLPGKKMENKKVVVNWAPTLGLKSQPQKSQMCTAS